MFIKNLYGIRRSMGKKSIDNNKPILYDSTRPICKETSAINLDVHYCQVCGELYYCGYKNEISNHLFITNDDPIEAQKYPEKIIIHIPTNGVTYNYNEWDPMPRWLDGHTGELKNNNLTQLIEVHFKPVLYDENLQRYSYPRSCVQCDTDWGTRRRSPVKSPIRTMGTGYNKFSQIIIEQLMGTLRESNSSIDNSKIVIFSDSRRDAALIAADLELNHYKDTVKALTEKHLNNAKDENFVLLDLINKLKQAKVDNNWNDITKHPYAKFDINGFRNLKGKTMKGG